MEKLVQPFGGSGSSLTSASPPLAFLNGRSRCPVERGKDRPKAFFNRAPHFRVGEHVKFIITNGSHGSSRHLGGVHASADPFGKSNIKRV